MVAEYRNVDLPHLLKPVASLVFFHNNLVYLRHTQVRTVIIDIFSKGKFLPEIEHRHVDFAQTPEEGKHVRQHLHMLKIAVERLKDWPKKYSEYKSPNRNLFSTFANDLEGVDGVDKWNVQSFGSGKAEASNDLISLIASTWQFLFEYELIYLQMSVSFITLFCLLCMEFCDRRVSSYPLGTREVLQIANCTLRYSIINYLTVYCFYYVYLLNIYLIISLLYQKYTKRIKYKCHFRTFSICRDISCQASTLEYFFSACGFLQGMTYDNKPELIFTNP
ncbi:unnamed protein product [Penicillium nalgiovense]|uniref:Uncharacterized protein n=1 Tax=Penicillium nalgiovense TaxID=60175 RepID=A0A9W4MNA5_PENNA|nr:unnamed protein product [Penicillium nalgiovense]CAG7970085.1 unnamed protein product [Penicillium nalgiovense]CAG7970973.1 unnamed protein product [Penicillium nalgiovense]CAG7974678.1 unnamed protein product [Penicillium nalgiovense]CAG7975407.1 unnamed protein product [Penicillium nalgiovense]